MKEINDAVDQLINQIDQTNQVQNFKSSKLKVQKNQALINQINAFNRDQDYRQELMENLDYQNYIKDLNELNYLILSINVKLKKILSSRSCK